MYRKANLKPPIINEDNVPDYIYSELENEKKTTEVKAQIENEIKSVIKVKIFYGVTFKIITTKRIETYKNLLQQTITEFQIAALINDCRLRSYNIQTQSMQETYDETPDATLDSLHIYAFKTLALEIKEKGTTFSQYDANIISIKINVWRTNILTIDEEILRPEKIFLSKSIKFSDLHQMIMTKYNIKKPM